MRRKSRSASTLASSGRPLVCWLPLKTASQRPTCQHRPKQTSDVVMSGQLAGAPGGKSDFPPPAFSSFNNGVRGVNASRANSASRMRNRPQTALAHICRCTRNLVTLSSLSRARRHDPDLRGAPRTFSRGPRTKRKKRTQPPFLRFLFGSFALTLRERTISFQRL